MSAYSIILADDHILVRQGLRRIMEEHSDLAVIGEAGDGMSLLDLLRQQPADLVIMDITMPGLSGTEACKRIKAGFPDTKVLILTMHKNKELLQHAIAAGADGYLLKEDATQELKKAIDCIRQGATYISPLLARVLEEFFIKSHRGAGPQEGAAELSAREIEIVKLIAEGKSSKEIAQLLCLSYRTVQNHRTSIMRKLNTCKCTDLVRYALLKGYASI